MHIFHWRAVIFPLSCALAFAPTRVQATPLSDLFQGQSLTVGNATLTDWKLTNLETIDGAIANPQLIDVSVLNADAQNLAIGFQATGNALSTPSSHPTSSLALLEFEFNAQTTNAGTDFFGNAIELHEMNFFAGLQAIVRTIATIRTPGGAMIAQPTAFFQPGFPSDSPTLIDQGQYEPLSLMKVAMRIDVAGPFANDMAELKSFELRFQLVPEPSGVLLAALSLALFAAGYRPRRH